MCAAKSRKGFPADIWLGGDFLWSLSGVLTRVCGELGLEKSKEQIPSCGTFLAPQTQCQAPAWTPPVLLLCFHPHYFLLACPQPPLSLLSSASSQFHARSPSLDLCPLFSTPPSTYAFAQAAGLSKSIIISFSCWPFSSRLILVQSPGD